MESVVVIANPVASQFTGGSHRDVMSELSKTYDVEATWPGSAAEATADAADAVDRGATIAVAIGGDGMVHHVAQALVGTDTALGIIPAGTTNVVARLLGLPSRQSKAARVISRDPWRDQIGTVQLDLKRGTTETRHHVMFAAGVGLDAEVVQVADADPYRKYRFGSLHYARSAISVGLRSFPSRKPHVTVSDGQREMFGTSALLQFREVYSYFGKISLRFQDESPDPISVLVIDRLKRRRIPRIFTSAVTHRDLDRIKGFSVMTKVEHLDFAADPPVAVQADGESLGLVDGGTVSWVPQSLKVIRDRDSSD